MPTLDPAIIVTRTIASFRILEAFDSAQGRIVRATVEKTFDDGSTKTSDHTLWEGDAYDQVGDWTTAQAEARVIELLSANS